MMKKTIFLVFTLFLSTHASANEQLKRLEQVSEELASLMYEAMIKSVEDEGADASQLRKIMPDTAWDDPMRKAASCVLEKYGEKIDDDGIGKMLDDMEALLPQLRGGGMSAFEKVGEIQPEGITTAESIEINTSCGMIELQQKSMDAGAFMSELMKLMGSQ